MQQGEALRLHGITYAKLTGGSGIQWPCNEEHPEGTERLYTDHVFPTDPSYCEIYGHDLATGAEMTPEQYKALKAEGKASSSPPITCRRSKQPDDDYPLWYSTGRVVFHFHTRTKTARSRALQEAAPEPYVQLSEVEAERYGINNGDMVQVESRRGKISAPARVGGIEPGHVFVPFHYGNWDDPEPETAPRTN